MTIPVELSGAPGSPYTRKMLSLLRYRRIPYRVNVSNKNVASGDDTGRYPPRAEPKVALLPTFYFQDEQGKEIAVTDSSPILRRFETEYTERRVVPDDPVLAFLDMLIEDYGDEWLTKPMFHYRWSYEADIEKAGQMLPRWRNTTSPENVIAPLSKTISDRQIARLSYVGSNSTTRDTIENSFKRFLGILDKQLINSRFLLGNRPSSCDFAIYGQLTCLALFDPTPQAIVVSTAPRVYAWTEFMEDLSGYELLADDWFDLSDGLPEPTRLLINEIGAIYAPYLLANAKAVMNKDALMETTLDGRPWQQNPFPYQLKCLAALRESYAALSASDTLRLDKLIAGSGVEQLFQKGKAS